MVCYSILPVTIFVLANTVCVSYSAAVGHPRLMNNPNHPGGDDSDLSLPAADFPSSSSSSAEVLPDWITSHPEKVGLDAKLMDTLRYDDDLALGARVRLQPPYGGSRLMIPDDDDVDGTAGRLRLYANGLARPVPVRDRQAALLWSPRFNYRSPAENFIKGNGMDKRSPRCIARCMQQGMVHPLQCHSLC